MQSAVTWSMARRSALAWSVQAIFLGWLLAWRVRLKRGAAHALEVLGGEAEVGQNLFVGDALARVLGQPSLGGSNGAVLFFADEFVLVGCVGQTAGELIEHDLEEADDGGDLSGSHAVDQLVRLLLRVGCGGCHGENPCLPG